MRSLRVSLIVIILLFANIKFLTASEHVFSGKFGVVHFGHLDQNSHLELLKKFDLIVIDHYLFPSIPTEIKKINPNIKIFAHINSFDIADLSIFYKKESRLSGKTKRMYDDWKMLDGFEDAFLHDFLGKRISVYVNKSRLRYALNIGDEKVKTYLRRNVRDALLGGYDGVFLDNIWVKNPFSFGLGRWISGVPSDISEKKWNNLSIQLLSFLKSAAGSKKVVFNQVNASLQKRSLSYLNVCDGASDEEWLNYSNPFYDYSEDSLSLFKIMVDQGKIIIAIARGSSRDDALFFYSAYLLIADGNNVYFVFGDSYDLKKIIWFDFYDLSLGEPISDFKKCKNEEKVFFRLFEKGIVIVNLSRSAFDLSFFSKMNIDLKKFTNKYGKLISNKLDSRRSVILLKK